MPRRRHLAAVDLASAMALLAAAGVHQATYSQVEQALRHLDVPGAYGDRSTLLGRLTEEGWRKTGRKQAVRWSTTPPTTTGE